MSDEEVKIEQANEEPIGKLASREEVLDTLRQRRDLSGADLSELDLTGMKFAGLKILNRQ